MAKYCPDCGARYGNEDDSCDRRFKMLLALDHSHKEPWGPRHGIAFAVYALQHPSAFKPLTLNRTWAILYRVYVKEDDPKKAFGALSGRSVTAGSDWDVPPRPTAPTHYPRVTIADLGDFPAEEYVTMLDAWARATVTWLHAKEGSGE